MHDSVMAFAGMVLTEDRVRGKRVLEVGSVNVNGSVRDFVERLGPSMYVGADFAPQDRYVDVVVDAENLVERFGADAFDVVVSTEMLEHVKDWRKCVESMKSVLAPGGLLVITARGPGFPIHAYPHDHWRFTTDDVSAMMQDFVALYLSNDPDPERPGFFYAGYKNPENREADPQPVSIPYHSRESFSARMTERRSSLDNQQPTPFRAFYHIACMGNWKDVVTEQCNTFHLEKIIPHAHVIGTRGDIEWLKDMPIEIISSSERLTDYETPTLQHLWGWSRENPRGAVLYVHTKGVSAPRDKNKEAWRRLMSAYVTERWRENLSKLRVADMVGVDWQNSHNYPHFAGNFWMARCDWINSLCSPSDYRSRGGPVIAGNPWERMHAEMWLGSAPWHHIESLCCHDTTLWRGDDVFRLLDKARFQR